MNSPIKTGLVAVAFVAVAIPAQSFAQSPQATQAGAPVTRAQVRAELVQLEKAGYRPTDWVSYPANLQQAQIVVAQQNRARTAYGPAQTGTSESGD